MDRSYRRSRVRRGRCSHRAEDGQRAVPACRCARPDAGRHCSRHLRHVGLGGAADIADQARRCQPRPRWCSRL